jgi:hypothetical protein
MVKEWEYWADRLNISLTGEGASAANMSSQLLESSETTPRSEREIQAAVISTDSAVVERAAILSGTPFAAADISKIELFANRGDPNLTNFSSQSNNFMELAEGIAVIEQYLQDIQTNRPSQRTDVLQRPQQSSAGTIMATTQLSNDSSAGSDVNLLDEVSLFLGEDEYDTDQ